ncbi:MAG: hypothetical protein JRD89_00455 [Deltaproteobacteria bacterium]|nr:hypothetical protein [Deltaproteobacteria bacterium]
MTEVPILVVGDSFLDILLDVGVTTEAEDAPTYKANRTYAAWGGAANVAWCLEWMNLPVSSALCWPYRDSSIAKWGNGQIMLPAQPYPCATTAPLQVRMRLRDNNGRLCRIDFPAPEEPYYFSGWKDDLQRMLNDKEWKVIVIADHGYLPELINEVVGQISLNCETIIIYDCNCRVPPPQRLLKHENCIIKANQSEIERWPYLKHTALTLIVTRETEPTQLFVNGCLYGTYEVPAQIAPASWEYSGAGDAFVARLAAQCAWVAPGDLTPHFLEEAVRNAQLFVLEYMSRWHERYKEVSG